MKNTSDSRHKHRQAGLKASATKGKEEEIRAAAMRAWTIEHGKNDAANPSLAAKLCRLAGMDCPLSVRPEPSIQ